MHSPSGPTISEKGLFPVCFALFITRFPCSPQGRFVMRHAAPKTSRLMPGRSSDSRAFRTAHLPALVAAGLKRRASSGQWLLNERHIPLIRAVRFPVTAAGPFPIFTGFPSCVYARPLAGTRSRTHPKIGRRDGDRFSGLQNKKSPCLQSYASMGIPYSILKVGRTLYHGSAPLLYDSIPVFRRLFLFQAAPLTTVKI